MKTMITIVSTLLAGATPFAASAALRHEAATTAAHSEFAVVSAPQQAVGRSAGQDSIEELRRAVDELRAEKDRLRAEIAAERERARALRRSAERQAVAQRDSQRQAEVQERALVIELETLLLASKKDSGEYKQLLELERAFESGDAGLWKRVVTRQEGGHTLIVSTGPDGTSTLVVQPGNDDSTAGVGHFFGASEGLSLGTGNRVYRQAQTDGARAARAAQLEELRSKQSALRSAMQHYKRTDSRYALIESKLQEIEERVSALERAGQSPTPKRTSSGTFFPGDAQTGTNLTRVRARVDDGRRHVIFEGAKGEIELFGDGEERHVVLTFEDAEGRTFIHDPQGGNNQEASKPAVIGRLGALFSVAETRQEARAPRPTRAAIALPPVAPSPSTPSPAPHLSPDRSPQAGTRWLRVGTLESEEPGVVIDVRPELKLDLHIAEAPRVNTGAPPARDELLREVHELTRAMLDELRELRAAVESLSDEVNAGRHGAPKTHGGPGAR